MAQWVKRINQKKVTFRGGGHEPKCVPSRPQVTRPDRGRYKPTRFRPLIVSATYKEGAAGHAWSDVFTCVYSILLNPKTLIRSGGALCDGKACSYLCSGAREVPLAPGGMPLPAVSIYTEPASCLHRVGMGLCIAYTNGCFHIGGKILFYISVHHVLGDLMTRHKIQ